MTVTEAVAAWASDHWVATSLILFALALSVGRIFRFSTTAIHNHYHHHHAPDCPGRHEEGSCPGKKESV